MKKQYKQYKIEMNKKVLLAGLMLAAVSMNISAQQKDGGISQ